METLLQSVPFLAAYIPALLFLAILCILPPIQNILCAILAYSSNEQTPGMPVRLDHNALSFRVVRTYQNSVENLAGFGFALLAAIMLGAAPFWVNLLAGIHLAFRLVFWAVYYSGSGKVAGGPRTLSYIGGMASNLALAGMAVYAGIMLV